MNVRTERSGLLVAVAVAAALVAGLAVLPAQACFMYAPSPVQVWLDHVRVDVIDQIAVKTFDCTFRNPNPQAVVGGACYMELEPGAQVDNMTVTVDGKVMQAEILDVEKANQVFQQIIKEGGSPALLEYYGNQLIQTQVPRIAPNGTVTVRLQYTTLLKQHGGLTRMQIPNTNPKGLMQPLKSASVTVNIRSGKPLKNVYSPTHDIQLVEKEGWDISAEWKQENYLPRYPFVIYFQTADEPVGASVLAHRELGEQGTFMLMLSPTMGQGSGKLSPTDILPKDVVFCVDSSGSMLQGGKMEQARGALKYCIENLRAGDRFNIVDFSTDVRSFHDQGVIEVNDESRARALAYVAKLSARGGTAIDEALAKSLEHLSGEGDRLKMIIFATDGLPTIGERDPDAILKSVAAKNSHGVRLFVFGEGFDVNARLLDFLALQNRGDVDYILPDEDIEKKIAHFYDRVGSPVMTNVNVVFEGLETADVFPRKIPDLFAGEQVILYGRYSGHGTKKIRITGNFGGEVKSFEYEVEFPEYSEDDTSAFIPRLWAGQKVDFLLNELRAQEKPARELVDEVTHLAKRYGIVTPYTSFLVTDDVVNARPAELAARFGAVGQPRLRAADIAAAPAGEAFSGAPMPAARRQELQAESVRDAKQQAENRGGYRLGKANALDSAADEAVRALGRREPALAALRFIGSKTFYKHGDEWFDADYDPDIKNVQSVAVGSDEYFKLISAHRDLPRYLALENVTVQVGGTWYRFENRNRKRD